MSYPVRRARDRWAVWVLMLGRTSQVEARVRQEANWLFTAINEAARKLADAPSRLLHSRELASAEQHAMPRSRPCSYGAGFR